MPKKTTKSETPAVTVEEFVADLTAEDVDALEDLAATEDPRAAIAALILSHTDGTPRTDIEGK